MAAELHPGARRGCGGHAESELRPNAYCGGRRSFRSCAIVEDPAQVAPQWAHFLRDAACPAGFDHADGEATQAGEVFRTVAHPDAAAVLIIVPIEKVVAAVLDGPVPAVDLKHPAWTGFCAGGRLVRP